MLTYSELANFLQRYPICWHCTAM